MNIPLTKVMNFSSAFRTPFMKVIKIKKTCKILTDSMYYTELLPTAKESYQNGGNWLVGEHHCHFMY